MATLCAAEHEHMWKAALRVAPAPGVFECVESDEVIEHAAPIIASKHYDAVLERHSRVLAAPRPHKALAARQPPPCVWRCNAPVHDHRIATVKHVRMVGAQRQGVDLSVLSCGCAPEPA